MKGTIGFFCLGELFVCALLFFGPVPAWSESKTVDEQGYFVEFIGFRADEPGKTFQEIYVRIPVSNLFFNQTPDGYKGHYRVNVKIESPAAAPVDALHYVDSVTVKTYGMVNDLQPHLIRFSFILDPGPHRCRFEVIDLNLDKHIYLSEQILVEDYATADLLLSDIKLSYQPREEAKRTSQVQSWENPPNVLGMFTTHDENVAFFSEVYNLHVASGDARKFIASFLIQNELGQKMRYMQKTLAKPGDSSVLRANIPIAGLASGYYRLLVRIKDLDSGQSVRKTKRFVIMNPTYL